MQTKFKKHQIVRILITPDKEYLEYSEEYEKEKPEIKKGMLGMINVILPNGQYHLEILNNKKEVIAYAPFSEEFLESIDENKTN